MPKEGPRDGQQGSLRSNGRGFLVVAGVLALTLSGLALSLVGGPLLWLPGQVLVALAILQWFVLLHDLGHAGFFRSRWLNDVAGHVASYFVILPFYPWRYVHAEHHRWVGWKDLDPTQSQVQPRELSQGARTLVDFCWRYWVPVFALSFSFGNFWNLPKLFRLCRKPGEKARCIWSCVFLILFVAPVFVFWPLEALRAYGLSYLLYLFVSDPLLLSQHAHIPQQLSRGETVRPVPLRQQDTYTRTLVFPEWASKWVLLRFDRHGAHHFFPTLPLYRLGAIDLPVRNRISWWEWLREAKRMPAHRLLLENRDDTGSRI
jgi:omega-6 fatty acid desaturase (delta-12 desaturase)